MHASLNKCQKASHRLSRKLHHYFWQEIRNIKIMKCPPNSSPQGDRNSNLNPNLKGNPKKTANLKVTTRCFTFRLSGTLRYTYPNWACLQLHLFLISGFLCSCSAYFFFFFCIYFSLSNAKLKEISLQRSESRNSCSVLKAKHTIWPLKSNFPHLWQLQVCPSTCSFAGLL